MRQALEIKQMKSIVKKAREIVTQLYERNMVAWNDLDREVIFAIQALIAEVQRMEAKLKEKNGYAEEKNP